MVRTTRYSEFNRCLDVSIFLGRRILQAKLVVNEAFEFARADVLSDAYKRKRHIAAICAGGNEGVADFYLKRLAGAWPNCHQNLHDYELKKA
ncbi:hypothetical protein E0I00_26055 [Pseudomonas syringae pv. actinidiae]|nr:hypothetical protein [Pseudomonas syringae pv. actinidiae]